MSEPVRTFPHARDLGEAHLPGANQPELPPAQESVNVRLNQTAEAVGGAVGTAVETVRELPRRFQVLKERFNVIRGRTREDAAAAAAEWRQTAEQRVAQTRTRAQQLAQEYPIHVVLGCALAGFILGFALRIWRSNHAE